MKIGKLILELFLGDHVDMSYMWNDGRPEDAEIPSHSMNEFELKAKAQRDRDKKKIIG